MHVNVGLALATWHLELRQISILPKSFLNGILLNINAGQYSIIHVTVSSSVDVAQARTLEIHRASGVGVHIRTGFGVRKRRIQVDVRVCVGLSMFLSRCSVHPVVIMSLSSCAFSRCIVGHVSCWPLIWQWGHRHRCGHGTGRWEQLGVDV